MKLDEILTELFDEEALSAYNRQGDERITYNVDGVPWSATISKNADGSVGACGAGPRRKLSDEEKTPRQVLVGFGTVVKWLADEIKAGNINHQIWISAADSKRLRIYTKMAKKLIEPMDWSINVTRGSLIMNDLKNPR